MLGKKTQHLFEYYPFWLWINNISLTYRIMPVINSCFTYIYYKTIQMNNFLRMFICTLWYSYTLIYCTFNKNDLITLKVHLGQKDLCLLYMYITKYTIHLHGYMHIPEHNSIMQVLLLGIQVWSMTRKYSLYVKMQQCSIDLDQPMYQLCLET